MVAHEALGRSGGDHGEPERGGLSLAANTGMILLAATNALDALAFSWHRRAPEPARAAA